MKSIKMLALAAVALFATACSDDDDKFEYNTAEATVEMADASVEVVENVGLFKVPVTITGNRNGYVTITVECTETGNDPAIANRHFFLTTDRINIPAGATTADVEFRAADFRGLDPDRTFNVTIVSAQGATVGANKTTTVTILDKGSSPLFNELPGVYILAGKTIDQNTGEDTDLIEQVNMSIVSSDGHGGGTVMLTGVLGSFQMEMVYDYDEEEKYGELVFHYGTIAMPNAGYDRITWINGQGSENGQPVRGKWNATYTAATFGDSITSFGIGVFDPSYLGMIDIMYSFTLMRVPEAE